MRAMVLQSLDGPGALFPAEVPEPHDPDRVVIEVRAAGVSYADALVLRGKYQLRIAPPFVPGTEVAGVVRSAPAGSGFCPGDRVAAFVRWGAWAEVAAAEPFYTFPVPEELPFPEAAALPLNYRTSHFALLWRGGLRAGETVLVHGTGGGVGSAAVQIAVASRARVLATAAGEEKQAVARGAGAEVVFDPGSAWLGLVRDATGGRGIDVVFDPVGGALFDDSVRCLAPGGRLLVVGFAGGAIPTVAVNRLLLRNASVAGVAFPEYAAGDPAMPRRVADEVLALLAKGRLRPAIGDRYPLERAGEAVRALEARTAVGKLVLVLG
ncbi:MAG: NADPH:quinone oxidoreductase family protein [Thermodesulfobacteriota bacterium]